MTVLKRISMKLSSDRHSLVSLARKAALPLLIALIFFADLGGPSLWEMDEPYFAEAAREMNASGHWLVPTFNGENRLQKPILFYWLIMLSYKLFGVSEFAARVPSALAALLTLLFTFRIARALQGRAAAWGSVFALATTIRFILAGRLALTDMTMLCLVTLALYLFILALHADAARQGALFLGMWAALALAMLTKGPVTLLLAGLTMLLTLLWTRKYDDIQNAQIITGLILFSVVGFSWYFFMVTKFGAAYLTSALVRDNISRFFTTSLGHSRPFLYFPRVIVGDFMPWTPFLVAALVLCVKENLVEKKPLSVALKFYLVWAAVVLAFFTACRFKVPHYVLPLYPALSLIVGDFFSRTIEAAGRKIPSILLIPSLCTALFFLLAAAALYLQLYFVLGLRDAFLPFLPCISLAVGALLLARILLRQRPEKVAAITFLTMAVSSIYFATFSWDPFEKYRPVRQFGEIIRSEGPDSSRVACFSILHSGLVFYAERQVKKIENADALIEFLDQPDQAFCVIDEKDYRSIRPSLAGKTTLFFLSVRPKYLPRFATLFGTGGVDEGSRLLLLSNEEAGKKSTGPAATKEMAKPEKPVSPRGSASPGR